MSSHEKGLEASFRKGLDKAQPKIKPEEQELITFKKATPQRVVLALLFIVLNPINWFKVLISGIRRVFK